MFNIFSIRYNFARTYRSIFTMIMVTRKTNIGLAQILLVIIPLPGFVTSTVIMPDRLHSDMAVSPIAYNCKRPTYRANAHQGYK
ncbi:MAG: hypothetical protein ACYTFK_04105 [Planctomycetota bacterium]